MSFTGPAPDHELEMKEAKYSRGKGADLEDGGAVGQELERPAHCKREATAKAAAQHRLAQQIEMLDPGDEAIFKLFLERYKGSPPPNVVAGLTALAHARNGSSRRGNVTVAEEVEKEDE
ncbi:uncharacterized protein [Miscanthus floridulus]|uniref:uncharacterized protein n=1 Tax=Miscanthus floridulus TaxID=154761 RepID=UPI003459C2AE